MTKSFKSFYMLGMAAMASVLTLSCSDNDTAVDNNNEEGINGTTSYLGVKVQMVGSSSSRATDGGFSDGTVEESTVSNVCALFFDKDGKYLTAGQKVTNINKSADQSTGSNIETELNDVVITLGPTTITSANAPIKMLLFVNDQCSNNWYSEPYGDDNTKVNEFANLIAKNPNLSDLVKSYVTNAEPKDVGSFEMTNSVYVNGTTLVQATEVGESYFKESQDEAKDVNNAVTAYVERTVAKAGMSITTTTQDYTKATTLNAYPFVYKSGDNDEVYFPIFTDGNIQPFTTNDNGTASETAFAVKVIGAIPNGVNTQGYLIKNLNVPTDEKYYKYYDATNNKWDKWNISSWNNTGYCRSYWAEDMNYTTTAEISSDTDDTRKNLKFYTFANAQSSAFANSDGTWSAPSKYIYENTVDQSKDHTWYKTEEQYPNVTTMLVAAQIVPLNGTFDSNQDFKLAADFSTKPVNTATDLWRYEGIYYSSQEKIIEKEEQVLKSYYYDAEHKNPIDDTWITTNLYDNGSSILTEMMAANGTGTKTYNGIYYGTKNEVDIFDSTGKSISVNNALADYFKENKISYFNNGYCFYQVPIEHPASTTGGDADKIYGVVRNHIYSLTLNSISNVGAPVSDLSSDETLELIPGKDQYYYIGCTMNVLAWRNVSQSVNL